LEEAIGLRKVIQESNKVFKVETLSVDVFFTSMLLANAGPSWNNDRNFTGKVTCSVPFSKSLLVMGFWCTDGDDSYPRWLLSGDHQVCGKDCGSGLDVIHDVCIYSAFHVFSSDLGIYSVM
jgi:hypothetical protein